VSSTPMIYGFDLITDASDHDVNPFGHRIVAIGLSTPSGTDLFEGPEAEIIRDVDEVLATWPVGVVVTWNGSLLDLPFFAARAAAHRLSTGLVLQVDARRAIASPIPVLEHACIAAWHDHRHLDLSRVYQQASPRWRVGMRRGIDHESMIPPSDDLAARDPRRDACLARSLTERRWSQARKHCDTLRSADRSGALGLALLEASGEVRETAGAEAVLSI